MSAQKLDTTIDELEPILIRGQFNQALKELKKAFERHMNAGEHGEARLIIGLAKNARSRRAGRL